MPVIDCLINLALNAFIQKYHQRINEKKLKADLKCFIEHQRKYNEICTLAEEFDFEGLIEYISNYLMEDVQKRFFSVNSKDREDAQKSIVAAAVCYSKANTDEARAKVSRLISMCLEIISKSIKNHISIEQYYLASEIVDSEKENTKSIIDTAKNDILSTVQEENDEIKKAQKEIIEKLDSSLIIPSGTLFSLDRAIQMSNDGQYDLIETNLNNFMNVLSMNHPLAPDYGYIFKDNKLKSSPKSKEALEHYPPKLHLEGTYDTHTFKGSDPLNYAYRHQLPLKFKVNKAYKLLGKLLDPIQTEAQELIGKDLEIKPPEFPPAQPYSIKVGTTTFFDYIMLRNQEIHEDGTYIIGNKEQAKSKITIEFHVKILSLQENLSCNDQSNEIVTDAANIKIGIKNATNHEMLNYDKFISRLSQGEEIHIYNLQFQTDIFSGVVNIKDDAKNIISLDEEIETLELICRIEDYFNVSLTLPEKISNQEYQSIVWLSNLITGEKVPFIWENSTFTITVNEKLKQFVETADSSPATYSYKGVVKTSLLGTNFEVSIMKIYNNAIIRDLDQIKNLSKNLPIGDTISITFDSGEDNTGYDILCDQNGN